MIDAPDLTVVIPFRGDTPERLENLQAVLKLLRKCMRNCDIVVLEDGLVPVAAHVNADEGIRYEFRVGRGAFHKTRLLNEGLSRSDRPYVASYDADTFLFPQAVAQALEKLRAGAGIVLPFSGDLFDIRRQARADLVRDCNLEAWSPSDLMSRRGKLGLRDLFEVVYVHNDHVGGAVFFDRKVFERCGGYNENFISWGYEDNEIVERFSKLGVGLVKIDGYPALHLSHRRKADSGKRNPHFRANVREYRRIRACPAGELAELVRAGALRFSERPSLPIRDRLESAMWAVLASVGVH